MVRLFLKNEHICSRMAYLFQLWMVFVVYFEHVSSFFRTDDSFPSTDFLDKIIISTGLGKDTLESNATSLYILGFFPLNESSQGMYKIGYVSKLSAELALHHINNNGNILKDVKLKMIIKDSKNDAGYVVNSLFKIRDEFEPNILMVIGALKNELSEAIAHVMNFWKVPQISYGSHTPSLSNDVYWNFYRTIPSTNGLNIPRIKFLKMWNWDAISTLHTNINLFNSVKYDFLLHCETAGIKILNSQDPDSFQDLPLRGAIESLKKSGARIIVGNFYEYDAVKIFCAAYNYGLYGENIVWLIYGNYNDNWWKPFDLARYNCSEEQMLTAVEGHFAFKFSVISNKEMYTIANITPEDYRHFILENAGMDLNKFSVPASYAYDAVWAAALAINASIEPIGIKKLSHFSNLSDAEKLILKRKLNDTQFNGVSGRVEFNSEGDRMGIYKITRMINGTYEDIAVYDEKEDHMEWFKTKEEIWGGLGKPPPDQDTLLIIKDQISRSLFASMIVICCLGVLLALAFLLFNISYRDERLIKMSSPNLNNVIIIGCIVLYITTILLGLDDRTVSSRDVLVFFCQLRTWISAFGFTLSFGAMFSKTWRVYSIFTNKKLQKRVIKDHRLFVMVGALLSIDVAIMTAWEFIAHPTAEQLVIRSYHDSNIKIEVKQMRCSGQHDHVFIWILLIYKGLLLIFGTFITWQTRNVNIPALNDSRSIALCIYNVVIFSALGLPLSFLLRENSNYTYGVIGGLIIFCTSLTLCLLFLPKVASIVQGYAPEDVGSRVMSNMNGRSSRGYCQGPASKSERQTDPATGLTVEKERTSETRLS